jgi:hypothetical protein
MQDLFLEPKLFTVTVKSNDLQEVGGTYGARGTVIQLNGTHATGNTEGAGIVFSDNADAKSGSDVAVVVGGGAYARAGGNISGGDFVVAGQSGCVVATATTSGKRVIGRALHLGAAYASGSLVPVLVNVQDYTF